jgi:DNA-binding NarL/FixJ family response regulator
MSTTAHIAWEVNVPESDSRIDAVLIADRPGREMMLRDMMQDTGVTGIIRRLAPGDRAVHRVQRTGEFRRSDLPDLFFFDFSNPDQRTISVLRQIAFGANRSEVPVILLTSPESEALLDSGDVDGGRAVMLTPTSLSACVDRMRVENRRAYFKALRIFYEFGPILVRTPEHVLSQETLENAISA